MAIRCRADGLVLDAMQRPVDFGIPFSMRTMHKIMSKSAAAAVRQRGYPAAAQGGVGAGDGSSNGGSSNGGGRKPPTKKSRAAAAGAGALEADQTSTLSSSSSPSSAAAGQASGNEAQMQASSGSGSSSSSSDPDLPPTQLQLETLSRLEALYASMPTAGLQPDSETVYILIRAAYNAGEYERAVAYAERFAAENEGAAMKPTAERLLEAVREKIGGGGGGGEGFVDAME